MHIAEIEIMLNESYEFLKLNTTLSFPWPFISMLHNEVGRICRLYSIFYKSFNVDKGIDLDSWWYGATTLIACNIIQILVLTKVIDGKVATTPSIQTARA